MAKGKNDIGMLADWAESALIIRPNAAVSSVFLRFIRGTKEYGSPPLSESGWPRTKSNTGEDFPNSPRRMRLKHGDRVTQHTFNI